MANPRKDGLGLLHTHTHTHTHKLGFYLYIYIFFYMGRHEITQYRLAKLNQLIEMNSEPVRSCCCCSYKIYYIYLCIGRPEKPPHDRFSPSACTYVILYYIKSHIDFTLCDVSHVSSRPACTTHVVTRVLVTLPIYLRSGPAAYNIGSGLGTAAVGGWSAAERAQVSVDWWKHIYTGKSIDLVGIHTVRCLYIYYGPTCTAAACLSAAVGRILLICARVVCRAAY